MSFVARYRGVCADCGEHFEPGTEIEYDETGAIVHVKCPETDDKPAGAPCPRCFTYHVGECL